MNTVRNPIVKGDYVPHWFFRKGIAMKLKFLDLEKKSLVIAWGARLTIAFEETYKEESIWRVRWEIDGDSNVQGSIPMNTQVLSGAFNLADYIDTRGNWSNWLIETYGADSAKIGRFIRYQNFLNIPCPGIGQNFDPNISLVINEQTRVAVAMLILTAEKDAQEWLYPEVRQLLTKYKNKDDLFRH